MGGWVVDVSRDAGKGVRFLVLNSGLWSPHYDNADLPDRLPDDHLDWLEAQLAEASRMRDQVVILSHVPPGE